MRTPPLNAQRNMSADCAITLTPPPKLALPPAALSAEDKAWADLDACIPFLKSRDTSRSSVYDPFHSDDEDDIDGLCPNGEDRELQIIDLPGGDVHVCGPGRPCRFLVANEDRMMVCQYSGIVFGPENTTEFFDLNGGTGKRSGDPDQSCGELVHGRFYRGFNPVKESLNAYEMARQMAEAGIEDGPITYQCAKDAVPVQRRSAKRGARCVGEDAPDSSAEAYVNQVKRSRLSKKNVSNTRIRTNLLVEAEQVLIRLVNYDRAASYRQKPKSDRPDRKRPPLDLRMCDQKFVFAASIKKYIKVCLARNEQPSMDAIHNLALMAQELSARVRLEAAGEDTDALRTVKFRTACSELIVALWCAACATPYMSAAKRGTDAFRPFVCGCIYGFKRGVCLADGALLLPPCPLLAEALPVLRGTGGNTLAKTLHSSSHRGLCTLSRCIASVPPKQQREAFAAVLIKARAFEKTTFTKHDV